MDEVAARVTQRAPQSCRPCQAKKRRCSKTVPCTACVHQGTVGQCQREQVILTKQFRSTEAQQHRLRHVAAHKQQHPLQPAASPGGSSTRPSPNYEATSAMPVSLLHQVPGDDVANDTVIVPSGNATTSVGRQLPTPSAAVGDAPAGHQPSWDGIDEIESSPAVEQDEASPFETTLTSLEYMVWGRQRDGVLPEPQAQVPVQHHGEADILSNKQALEILQHHWEWLTWTHNIIHWPQFRDECQLYWSEGVVKEKAWLGLYYAVLCVGLHHMAFEQRDELGFSADSCVPSQLYHRCIDALKEADYASVHTLVSVQTICLLVLCAHDFNGSNLLLVLLSAAIRIAQALNIHRLGPDPTEPLPYQQAIQRETQKCIWMFLSTQDWFLIPFSNAHIITPTYCTTPLPLNCDAIAGFTRRGNPFSQRPLGEPTLMSYQLIAHKVAEVLRAFFDDTSSPSSDLTQDVALRRLYDRVLKADLEMEAITRSLPNFLVPGYQDTENKLPGYFPRQQYHLAISIAHKTLIIHRRFFLRSLRDRWYNYTQVKCVSCARTILTQFRSASDESTSRNLWTVLAHVVSACVILLLELIYSQDDREGAAAQHQLVADCLIQLKNSNNKSSTMSARGISLIELLLRYSNDRNAEGAGRFDDRADPNMPGGTRSKALNLKTVAAYLDMDQSTQMGSDLLIEPGGDSFAMDFDKGEFDMWMQHLEMPDVLRTGIFKAMFN